MQIKPAVVAAKFLFAPVSQCRVLVVEKGSFGVDTAEDLEKVERLLAEAS